MTNKEWFHAIYTFYSKYMNIHTLKGNKDEYYAYIFNKEVILPEHAFDNPTEWDVFALLHEIGHVATNTKRMKRYEKEYWATRWAMMAANQMGFQVSKETLDIYQKYIWDWRNQSKSHTPISNGGLILAPPGRHAGSA